MTFLFFHSVLCLLSSVLCLLSSVFCLLSSVFCPLSSVLCLLSSVLHPLSESAAMRYVSSMIFRSADDAASYIRDHRIVMVDLKFCDLWGRWHHVTLPAQRFTRGLLEKGVGFDGSSVGFKTVSAGDMVLHPDLEAAFPD